ncbi:hypothetical protein G6F63_015410 [Rhizopus arrhizus]|nr:hypothetical protein G6F63_015410 [Rhizopus arrhizus]
MFAVASQDVVAQRDGVRAKLGRGRMGEIYDRIIGRHSSFTTEDRRCRRLLEPAWPPALECWPPPEAAWAGSVQDREEAARPWPSPAAGPCAPRARS